MSLEKIRTPYEFLVRFENGNVKGAHIGWVDKYIDNGVEVAQNISVEAVAMGETQGFPLDSIIDLVTAGVIIQNEQLAARIGELTAQKEALEKNKQDLVDEVTRLQELLDAASLSQGLSQEGGI